jgi:threonine synthase
MGSALIAVNHEYAFPEDIVRDGDEIAVFPPVSGGATDASWPEYFSVTNERLDIDRLVEMITRPETGAVAIFSGAVRGVTHKSNMPVNTSHLFYEAYEPMVEKTLRQVAAEIRSQWPKVQGIAIIQRIGRLQVGETTILVACSSGHRNDGIFEAAHYGINRVKEIVPVWKKEVGPDGSQWVEGEYHPTPMDKRTVGVPATQESHIKFSVGCASCGEEYPLDTLRYECDCGGLLTILESPSFDSNEIDQSVSSMWRYRSFLAPANVDPISLGEGWTPLIPLSVENSHIYAKLESLNPTGSFKDRGASLLVSLLKNAGVQFVHDDSSGNAGAALAAYAARAEMDASLFVPDTASPTKLAQIELYGAHLERIEGLRIAATQAAIYAAERRESVYASHVRHPAALLAYKSIAFEIWEQLYKNSPDAVVLPLGHGSQLLGLFWGFRDLLNAGLITALPRLVGVQALACAPLAHRFSAHPAQTEINSTLAEGIAIADPIRGDEILEAIRESQGSILAVSEEEIILGFHALAERGIFAEPTSAVVWAALPQLRDMLAPDATIVLSISGTGLKTPDIERFTQKARQH